MQINHSGHLTLWCFLLYRIHTVTLQQETPAWNRNWNWKLPPRIHVLHCTCMYPSEPESESVLIARENPVLVCYFPPSGIKAIAPRRAMNQCLIIYHPLLNVSCCLWLLSRVGIYFLAGLSNNPVWSFKGTGILQGEGHLFPLKPLLGSINFVQ